MRRFTSRFIGSNKWMPSLLALALAAQAVLANAQQKVPPNPARIAQAIDDSAVTVLKGNVRPLANAKNDLGAAPVSQPMPHVQLVLQRSTAQEAALESYLAQVQSKNSASYHKWLTPQQFGALYGPNDADIAAITAWLTTHGFTVNKVANGRTFIDFSGSVSQIQSAFHTSIHSYQANGLRFYANATNPGIPTALAPVVSGITHLNNIPLKPQHVQASPAKFDSQSHRFVPAASKLHGQYTENTGNSDYNLVMVPADAATVYDTPNATLNGKFNGSASYTGAGATIGVMGQSAIDLTYVQNYRNLFVGDTKAPIVTNIDGVGDVSGDDTESYLDNELAGGLAPGATIHFYTSSDVVTSSQYAIDTDDTIDVLSLSYGNCELENTTSENQAINALWQQAAAQGITVVVSAGDTGSTSCDASDSSTTAAAFGPLSVNGLASTPWDIAVGGTDFDALYPGTSNDFGTYVSTSEGTPATHYRTALGYIPEATWNDSTLNNTTTADNIPITADGYSPDLAAGSGGPSNCAINTSTDSAAGNCTSGYPKPSWQNPATISGMPNDQARDIPDVSFLAGTGVYGAFWAICDGSSAGFDASANAGTADCVADSAGDFYTDGVGGTSAATPAFAGIMAMVVQRTGQRQGQAAPILYSLYVSNPLIFHDVNLGNNSLPCSPSVYNTASCAVNSQGYDFMTGYDSNAGYDLATGLGSVDATLLVDSWIGASGSLDVADVTATPSATAITIADPLTFTVNVASITTGGATPAGTVSATDGTYTSPSPITLVGGSATITIPANSLAANSADVFAISYAPATGSSFAPASDFVTIAITSTTAPTGTFTLSATSATASSPGQSGTATITVTPSASPAYSGTVNFSCALATSPSGANASYYPGCSVAATTVVAGTAAKTLATFTTTAASSAALAHPLPDRQPKRWYEATGGAALACILFFGIPARRRGWRSMLSLLVFLAAMTGLGCGGGGGNTNNVPTGTTTGTYTFTVVATDSVNTAITQTTTVTLTVN